MTTEVLLQGPAPAEPHEAARAPRVATLAICAMAALTLIYVSLASTDIVVSAQGHVIPSGKSKVIQPLETGVVKTIAVHDGQAVHAGEVLLELDPTATTADRDRLQAELWDHEAEVLRLDALLHGRGSFGLPAGMPE